MEPRIDRLTPQEKRELLAELMRARIQEDSEGFPLSFGQRALWFLYRLAPESPAYNIVYGARARFRLDPDALLHALRVLSQRHPALRVTIATKDGEALQRVHPDQEVDFEAKDVSRQSWSEVQRWCEEEADRPFDLERGPVLRVRLLSRGPADHVLLLVAHHIVLDFWSLDLLLEELRDLYAPGESGSPARKSGQQYVDYVRWQRDMVAGPEGERLWAFWREELAGDLPVLDLPCARPRPPVQTYRGAEHRLELDEELTGSLRRLATAERTTLFSTLLAGFQVLLFRYSGQEDIVVGAPLAGRGRPGLENTVGYFVNALPLRSDLSGDPIFRSFLHRVRRVVLDALAHQDFPFSLLVERLQPVRDLSRPPLFQVAFVWDKPRRSGGQQMAPSASAEGEVYAPDAFLLGQRGAPFDLMLKVVEGRESLSASLQYNTDLFDAGTIERMAGHLLRLLGGIATSPDQAVSRLPLLSEAEHHRIAVQWNNTAREYGDDRFPHECLEAQAARRPDAVAVVMAGEDSEQDLRSFTSRVEDRRDPAPPEVLSAERLTYGELNQRANRLARYLRAQGVEKEALVGLFTERSLDLVVGLLAILKAGGVYLPLEFGHPTARLRSILEGVRLGAVLTVEELAGHLPEVDAKVIRIDRDTHAFERESTENPPRTVSPRNGAYAIFTSGSTGGPKGVLNTHSGLSNRLAWMQEAYGLRRADRVLHKTPLGFDVSIWEILWPLMVGARLVLARPGAHRNSTALCKTIADNGVTTVHFVPPMLQVLLSDPAVRACRSLRRVVCSGDVLSKGLQDEFFRRLGDQAELCNLYGPTEASIDVTAWTCDREDPDPSVPIGRPIANCSIYLLDEHLQLVPVGNPGELYIGGVGLARGYLNAPGLTAESFLPDPFTNAPGERMYRTGDIARYRSDGAIEFLGRRDHQVKIRGVRIALGEIEAALLQHPGVVDCVVTEREDGGGSRQLVAHFVSEAVPQPTVAELRCFLLERLPDAMVPAAFYALEALPLTSNGKVDRGALPELQTIQSDVGGEYVPPRNERERQLVEIWKTVLGLDRVGVHDSFFTLGGASTQSLQLAALANDIGIPLTAESIFRYETVAKLAAAYGGDGAATKLLPSGNGELVRNAAPFAAPSASPTGREPVRTRNTVIESLGVYLPPEVISTADVVAGCWEELQMPLERLTGIRSRRVAGKTEFSLDLARKAIEDCLSRSRYAPEEVDVLVCCSISRCGPDDSFQLEPSMSATLRATLGFENALVFDISNACAGMFTGVAVVDAFLKTGLFRRGMVVSGEYISHLTRTAQKEIEGFLDTRVACLTLGDAGAAVLLEESDRGVGFHQLDMYTLSRYSTLCIAKATDRPHGGAIMYTEAIEQTAIAVHQGVQHSLSVLEKGGWGPEGFHHLLMHQTSETALRDAVRATNDAFERKVLHEGNTIYNLAERGNTATTSHFVAIMDHIRSGRIKSGDRMVLGITGSGQTIGAALYTFDDLPDRVRRNEARKVPAESVPGSDCDGPRWDSAGQARIRIAGTGCVMDRADLRGDSVELAQAAAAECLAGLPFEPTDLELLIHTGVYRKDFLCEPSVASLVAGNLRINDDVKSPQDKKTFAFDLVNGAIGYLNACHAATLMIRSGTFGNALVMTSEIENNRDVRPDELRGIEEAGAAVLLEPASDDCSGFGQFVFHHHMEALDALQARSRFEDGKTYLHLEQDHGIEESYLLHLQEALEECLKIENLDRRSITCVFPPQISRGFLSRLAGRIGIDESRFVDLTRDGGDLFTSSFPAALDFARRQGIVAEGDVGLVLGVGAGIQVGCVVYYF